MGGRIMTLYEATHLDSKPWEWDTPEDDDADLPDSEFCQWDEQPWDLSEEDEPK